MSILPSTWITAPLGAFTDDCTQRVPGEAETFTYIDIGSVNRETKRIESPQRLVGKEAPSRARKHVRAGDVLVSMTRPNLNAVALVPYDLDGQIASTGFDVLRATGIDPRWAFYLVRSTKFVEVMSELVQGALYPAVRSKDVRRFEAPLAPLNEQKRIADKLDAVLARVDVCRDRLGRVPAILKRFRQTVLASAMGGELTADWRAGSESIDEPKVFLPDAMAERAKWSREALPQCWRWKSFGETFSDETDSNRKLPQSSYAEAGAIPVVDQGASLIGGYTERSDLVSVAPLPAIVFGDHTRCVKYVDFNFVQGADGVKVLCPIKDTIAPRFAYYALLACELPDKGYSRHMKFLKASHFPCPPTVEQSEIVRRVETLFTFADRLEARYATARAQVEKLTPSLLAKAFRGELVPQDPNDEPACMLLERIREHGASQVITKKNGRSSKEKPMKTSPPISVSEIIGRMGSDSFTFEQLREEASRDYESLKDELFALLADAGSGITQVFDAETQSMSFKRVRK